jgi:hypothetical protein
MYSSPAQKIQTASEKNLIAEKIQNLISLTFDIVKLSPFFFQFLLEHFNFFCKLFDRFAIGIVEYCLRRSRHLTVLAAFCLQKY